jgi:hypothetical protein
VEKGKELLDEGVQKGKEKAGRILGTDKDEGR